MIHKRSILASLNTHPFCEIRSTQNSEFDSANSVTCLYIKSVICNHIGRSGEQDLGYSARMVSNEDMAPLL